MNNQISQLAIIILLLLFCCASVMSVTAAEVEIEEAVLGMNVSGNKEAPNILYIIPWKSNFDDATPPEVTRLMDEIYSTVDPDVYDKEVLFFEQLAEVENKE
jgi:hypothetical protein